MKKQIKSELLKEEYTQIKHASGLTLCLCPMKGYSTTYAVFATKYGSIDNFFKTEKEEDFIGVPPGIAHFLEHKMFEDEDGDAFAKYAKTGASANAFTTFDKTAYLFSCSENFKESLDILLNFVTHPYFTPESVAKEQGIIAQEIAMYDDDADFQVLFNLLKIVYHHHNIREDIAGSAQSIAQIDADLLYRCYHTFYNLNNMVLSIAGNFEIDDVLQLCDRILKPSAPIKIERKSMEPEPLSVAQTYIETTSEVSMPQFCFAFKHVINDAITNQKNKILDSMILNIILGEFTAIYQSLYNGGLINDTFGSECMAGDDFYLTIFSGESKDPKKVQTLICQEIERVKANGLDPELFEICKRTFYGGYIGTFEKPENVASLMMNSFFYGITAFDLAEIVSQITLEQLNARLNTAFDTTNTSLSVVLPKAVA